jgi:hypothetical protein
MNELKDFEVVITSALTWARLSDPNDGWKKRVNKAFGYGNNLSITQVSREWQIRLGDGKIDRIRKMLSW